MAASLVPCPSCGRHVRVAERACPFCAASLSRGAQSAAVIPSATQRMSRAAAFTFAASLAIAGCGDSTPSPDAAVDSGGNTDTGNPSDNGTPVDTGTPTDSGAPDDNGGPVPLYGAPADVPPAQDVPAVDAGPSDDGGAMPLYGAPADVPPAQDVPEADTGPVDDGGGIAPLYGLPPPDAGDRDGSIGLRYGAPPPFDAG